MSSIAAISSMHAVNYYNIPQHQQIGTNTSISTLDEESHVKRNEQRVTIRPEGTTVTLQDAVAIRLNIGDEEDNAAGSLPAPADTNGRV